MPCRTAVKRIAAWLSSQGKKLANDEDDPYIKARQRLPETVPLRVMKHIDRRCHRSSGPGGPRGAIPWGHPARTATT